MNNIPEKLREEMSKDPYYQVCARKGLYCKGRITWEHSYIYQNRQIQERWAIIPLCIFHHLSDGLDKNKNQLIALERASKEDLAKYPRIDWGQEKKRLIFEKVKYKSSKLHPLRITRG